jgi:hypothetical protein
MAVRKEKLITADPPLKVTTTIFIHGDRGPLSLLGSDYWS